MVVPLCFLSVLVKQFSQLYKGNPPKKRLLLLTSLCGKRLLFTLADHTCSRRESYLSLSSLKDADVPEGKVRVGCSSSSCIMSWGYAVCAMVLYVTEVYSALRGCPAQCSCTLERSYHSITGPFDQVDVLCNRYAAQFDADLGKAPNIANLRSDGRNIKLSIEQMLFQHLPVEIIGTQKLISLRLLHNPKLKSVDKEIFWNSKASLKHLAVLDHDNLERFPLRAVSNCGEMSELSLQLKKALVGQPRLSLRKFAHLRSLSLVGQQFLAAIPEIRSLKNLRQLSLSGMNLTSDSLLNNILNSLPNLSSLNLASNNLESLPTEISGATNLKVLSLENNAFTFEPSRPYFDSIPKNLEVLNLRSNQFRSIPCETFKLPNLRYLKLSSKIICLKCAGDGDLVARLNRTCDSDQTWFFGEISPATTPRQKPLIPTTTARSSSVETTFKHEISGDSVTRKSLKEADSKTTETPGVTRGADQYYEYMDVLSYYDISPEGSGELDDSQLEWTSSTAQIFGISDAPPSTSTSPQQSAAVNTKAPNTPLSSVNVFDVSVLLKSLSHVSDLRKRPPIVKSRRDEIRKIDNSPGIGTEYYYYEYTDDTVFQSDQGSGETDIM